jgi:hypothetical protein
LLSRLGQFTQILIANVTTDENFAVDVEFMSYGDKRLKGRDVEE